MAVNDKKFSILGDKGINEMVSDTFWNSITEIVLEKFKNDDFTEGLKLGIIEAGLKLKQFFPYQSDDKNELPDSISLS